MHVIGMYRRGHLATLDEGALIAGVARSRVLAWLRTAGIDWRAARWRWVAKQRYRAVALDEGRKLRRPTKQDLRRTADWAKQQWDRRHAAQ